MRNHGGSCEIMALNVPERSWKCLNFPGSAWNCRKLPESPQFVYMEGMILPEIARSGLTPKKPKNQETWMFLNDNTNITSIICDKVQGSANQIWFHDWGSSTSHKDKPRQQLRSCCSWRTLHNLAEKSTKHIEHSNLKRWHSHQKERGGVGPAPPT